MELRELRAFVAVVQDGGLSAAARRLHVSQSALSQSMQVLERQLGVALLVRDHAGAQPTAAGKVLAQEAIALLEHHDRVARRMAMLSGSHPATAPIRVGVPLELPSDLLPNALAQLAKAFPECRVDVRHASSVAQLTALRAGDLDLVLVRDRPSGPEFDAVLAVRESMGVIVAATHGANLADPAGVSLHRLHGLRWIGFARSDTPAWYDQVVATLRGHGVTVEDPAPANDRPVTSEVKLASVGAGGSFALASAGWSQPLPTDLSWHRLSGDPIVRRTWAVWRADSRRRDLAALVAALEIDDH